MQHITINTGDMRESPRREVAPHVTRDPCRPKRWFWGEAPWGSCAPRDFQRTWPAVFFGADNCRGILSWQLEDHEKSGAGVIRADDRPAATYPLLRTFARVVCSESKFFSVFHRDVNADGFPVVQPDLFRETNPEVMTRLLSRHLVAFNCGSRAASLTLRNRAHHTLTPVVQPGWPQTSTASCQGDDVRIQNLVPWQLYVFRVEPEPGR